MFGGVVSKGVITFEICLSVSHPNFLAGRDCISPVCLLVYFICLLVNFIKILENSSTQGFSLLWKKKTKQP